MKKKNKNKNEDVTLEPGKNTFDCKGSFTMVFSDESTLSGWVKSKTLFWSSLFKFKGFASLRQYNIDISYLNDLETFTVWLKNKLKTRFLETSKLIGYEGELHINTCLGEIKNIRSGLVPCEHGVKYTFPNLHEFCHFSYHVCCVLGLGYEMRQFESEFPISFKKFKSIQLSSKYMYNGCIEVESVVGDENHKEVDRWLM